MELYLQQLIEDFRASVKRRFEPDKLSESMDENPLELINHFEQVERFINGPSQKLSEIIGIEKIQLPPVNELSYRQAATVYEEMELLLQAYNFVPDFPDGLPVDLKYRLLRETWDSEQILVDAGEIHLEFCSYAPDVCPFPKEYCQCRKYNEENIE